VKTSQVAESSGVIGITFGGESPKMSTHVPGMFHLVKSSSGVIGGHPYTVGRNRWYYTGTLLEIP